MQLVLPRLYVILDAGLLTIPVNECAKDLAASGVRLIQYRNKTAAARELLNTSRELSSLLKPLHVLFFVNDRADVAALARADGVHVGQEDLDVEQARSVIGEEKWVGVSTHNAEQFQRAAATRADYIAVGPIFATGTKANADPVMGVELIKQARAMTRKPIVAIGGITLERAREVIEAGADSVAVGSDILRAPHPRVRARQYMDLLGPYGQAVGTRRQ
ncbi:MAG TPA: thiamine phosphate synthase [Candidatus Dormibacteraeota bacterium]|nr:thiamine phosphate synthase [Candidatus Dormibacteraeota bacterium]